MLSDEVRLMQEAMCREAPCMKFAWRVHEVCMKGACVYKVCSWARKCACSVHAWQCCRQTENECVGGGGGDAELRHIRPPILTTIFCASLATMLATLSPFMLHIIPENSSAANECMPCTHRLRPPYRMWVVCVRLDLVCDRRSRCWHLEAWRFQVSSGGGGGGVQNLKEGSAPQYVALARNRLSTSVKCQQTWEQPANHHCCNVHTRLGTYQNQNLCMPAMTC